jgi:uncharacterized damage-inducible protein DinB
MDRQELLLSPLAYMPPPRLLAGLDAETVACVLPGATHSIVEILAHLVFWQSWFLDRCAGNARPMPQAAALGWPKAGAEDWEPLRAQFLTDLERAAAWPGDGPVTPAIETPGMARYTISEALTHLAVHNAHHLGQIITLRQLLGAWPPPEGSWTW